jgi:hypothetical protein
MNHVQLINNSCFLLPKTSHLKKPRNPAIQIIAKDGKKEECVNERERGSEWTSTSSSRPAAVVSANEKPEPRWSSSSPASQQCQDHGKLVLPSQLWSREESHEAVSRLEALLRPTLTLSSKLTSTKLIPAVVKKHDNSLWPRLYDSTSVRENNVLNPVCHSVKIEKQSSTTTTLTRSSSRLPLPKAKVSKHKSRIFVASANPSEDLNLTELWNESHKDSRQEDAKGREKAGKRYRSSIRIMVRPEVVQQLQRPIRANSSDGFTRSSARSGSESSRSAKKMSAAGIRGAVTASCASSISTAASSSEDTPKIVKEQFR